MYFVTISRFCVCVKARKKEKERRKRNCQADLHPQFISKYRYTNTYYTQTYTTSKKWARQKWNQQTKCATNWKTSRERKNERKRARFFRRLNYKRKSEYLKWNERKRKTFANKNVSLTDSNERITSSCRRRHSHRFFFLCLLANLFAFHASTQALWRIYKKYCFSSSFHDKLFAHASSCSLSLSAKEQVKKFRFKAQHNAWCSHNHSIRSIEIRRESRRVHCSIL